MAQDAPEATGDGDGDGARRIARGAPESMPSVVRRGRVTARVTLAVFAASCVVAIVGLTLITMALVARR